ncbi:GNAT family N-acetyltransferase [Kitasatospora cinereorecta]
MDHGTVTLTAGPLLLRPWRPDDIPALLAAYDDPAMRHWLRTQVSDAADAERWIEVQREGWASGSRLSFAVTDTAREGELVGNLALKRPVADAESAEAGYWTSAAARGRGVASRALGALTDWAFTAFAGEGLRRLELLHQVDNEASCRVAEKSGYALAEVVPALPPQYPLDGHRHVRHAPPAPRGTLSAPAGRRAGSAGTSGGPATRR